MPRISLAERLADIKASYLRDLDTRSARYRDAPGVRAAKEKVLQSLTDMTPDSSVSDQAKQLREKLALLSSIQFGDELQLDNPKALQFKRSKLADGGFLIGVAKGLLSAFGALPGMHFAEVLVEARKLLVAELAALGTLSYSTSAEVAAGTSITAAAVQAGRQETTIEAMADFARNTCLAGKAYTHELASDEAYEHMIAKEILKLTGEKDITKGYAGEIAHLAAQAVAAVVIRELPNKIPGLSSTPPEGQFAAVFNSGQFDWVKAEDKREGFFLNIKIPMVALQRRDDPERLYCVNPDLSSSDPQIVDYESFKKIRAELPPLLSLEARVRYVLTAGATRPIPSVESLQIINCYPDFLPFSQVATAELQGTAVPDSKANAAGVGKETGMPHWVADSSRLASSPTDPIAYARSPITTPVFALKQDASSDPSTSEEEGGGTRRHP